MNFLPDSEIINLKYQLAQQIKANINRAASSKNSSTPFLESCIDTLIDEIADLKIEMSKLSLTLSNIQNEDTRTSLESSNEHGEQILNETNTTDTNITDTNNIVAFPIRLNPEYLQNINNFYYPETGDNDNSYIWTGPDTTTSIELPLNVAFPIKIIIKDVRFITDAIKESLQIFVNGEKLELEIFKQNEEYTITSIWLPLHSQNKSQCTIDICADKTISVKEIHPDANDTRKLCMAFKEIEITNNALEYVNT